MKTYDLMEGDALMSEEDVKVVFNNTGDSILFMPNHMNSSFGYIYLEVDGELVTLYEGDLERIKQAIEFGERKIKMSRELCEYTPDIPTEIVSKNNP